MNFDKIKELLKNRKVQAISALGLCGVIAIGASIFMINGTKDNTKVEKAVAIESKNEENKEKKEVTEEEAKKKLDELKSTDISKLSEEDKKKTEDQIKTIESMIEKKEYSKVETEVENVKNNIAAKVETPENKEVKKEEATTKVEEKKTETKKEEVEASTPVEEKNSEPVKVETHKVEEKKTEPVKTHTHTWVDITETVNHAEEGHWEEVVVKPEQVKEVPVYESKCLEICNGCGADITGRTTAHKKEQMLAGNMACSGHHEEYKEVQTGTKQEVIPAVTEKKWIVDKAAWAETKVVGKKCSSCGATE